MSNALMTILLSLAPFTVAACGGSKAAEPTTTPVSTSSTSSGGAQAACVDVMTRNRTCTTEFIPALVDIRAKYNNPEGVTDAVKADRNAVVSQALQEWAVDSKDDAIARTCTDMAAAAADAEIETGKGCLAQADCAGYVSCIMPQFEKRFAK